MFIPKSKGQIKKKAGKAETMWNRKLCLSVLDYGMSVPDAIRYFHTVGFDGFFPGWSRGCPVKEWAETARAENMLFQSIHAPFNRIRELWVGNDETAADVLDELTACLTDCAENDVPIMICHTFIGFTEHNPTQIGIDRFGILMERAEKLGVTVAFENTEGEEYLDALMKAFASSPALGFCYDSGHEMCYNHSKDMLALYGDKLVGTHLNDNLGIRDFGGNITWHDDLHLLPFDGIADWKKIAQRIEKCGFDGPLTFELTRSSKPGRSDNAKYGKMSGEEYITECYARACRVAALFPDIFEQH